MNKKVWVVVLCCLAFLFLIIKCSELPDTPYKVSNAEVSLVLESSLKQISDNMIQDSSGKVLRIGVGCHMPQFIDSIRIKLLISGSLLELDTVFSAMKQTTGFDTVWYPKTFTFGGTRTVQVTAYLEDKTTIFKSGVIIVDGLPNQKPVVKVTGSLNPLPNNPCTLFVEGTDSDVGQVLSYSTGNLPAGAVFANKKFIWTPSSADTGVVDLMFRVTDNGLPQLSDSVNVSLVVNLSLPKPSKPAGIVVVERKVSSVALRWLSAQYADSYLIYQSNGGGAFALRNSIYDTTFTDVIGTGPYSYFVSAKNRVGETSSDTITVSSFNTSNALWNADSFNVVINEGQIYQLSLPQQCKVGNNDTLQFKVLSSDSLSDTITSQKVYSYIPSYIDSGSYSILICAQYATILDTFKLNLKVENVNRAPLFLSGSPKLSQFVLEADTLKVAFGTIDQDGDPVSYHVSNVTLPRSATVELSQIDGVLKWVAASGDSGLYSLDLVAADSIDSTVCHLTVVVGKGNVAPSWSADTLLVSVKENTLCSLDLAAISADPNDDTLKYSLISGLPSGDTIIGTMYYKYMPGYSDSGTYSNVKIVVSDSALSDTLKLTIKVVNVNRPPVISGVYDTTIVPGDSLSFTVNVTDPDSDLVSIFARILPSGAMFNQSTSVFSFPTAEQGSHQVVFVASDGKDSVVKSIVISVSTINPPVISTQPANVAICTGQSATFAIQATGTGTLMYQWRKDGLDLSGKTTDSLVIQSVVATDSGLYSCIVSDTRGQTTSSSVVKLTALLPSVSPTSAGVTANPTSICFGGSSILKVASGELGSGATAWKWYTNRACTLAVAGTINADGSQITVTPATSGTKKYFVRAEGLCNTTIDSVSLGVTAIPLMPVSVSNDTSIYVGDSVTLSASLSSILLIGRVGTIAWYTGSCGGTALKSNVVSPAVGTTTYYVRTENGSCYSACDSVKVTVKNLLILTH